MTRDEHLAWAKRRALEYVDLGQLDNALASMGSDLAKHAETRASAAAAFMLPGLHAALNSEAILAHWRETTDGDELVRALKPLEHPR